MENIENKKTKENSIEEMSYWRVIEQDQEAAFEALIENSMNYVNSVKGKLLDNLSEEERMRFFFQEYMSHGQISVKEYQAKLGAFISDGKMNVHFEDNDSTTIDFPFAEGNLENFRQALINIRDNGIYDLDKISMLERLKRKEAKRKAKKMAMRKTKRKAQTKARRVNRKGKVQ
ncbi:hypothetical protein [Vibrio splendidus]|uniref:hypothetical protein n=1 Tax=Vibrio splendidus TaxID=29497 RepID=UPI003D1140CA